MVYLKMGQRVSNTVITTGDMRYYYINIIASTKIQQANQCHGSWVTRRALTPDIHSLMPQDQRDGVPFGLSGGFKPAGHRPKQSSEFCGKNYLPLSTLFTHGATNGPNRRHCSTVIIKQLEIHF